MAISVVPSAFNPNQKSATPESWQNGTIQPFQPERSPQPVTERPAPISEAAAQGRLEAEKYVERQNEKLRRRKAKQANR